MIVILLKFQGKKKEEMERKHNLCASKVEGKLFCSQIF